MNDLPCNDPLLILGKVYNITPYCKFHPGGIDELMKGAGRDGTELFDEVRSFTLLFHHAYFVLFLFIKHLSKMFNTASPTATTLAS